MTTPIRTAIVTNATTTRRHLALTMLLGVSIGAAGVVGAMQYVPVVDDAMVYRLLKAGCKFPSLPGEAATWAIGPSGLIDCWEQRDRGGK